MAHEEWRQVALFMSPEIEEVLADNGASMVELLQAEGLDLQRSATYPKGVADSGAKEPVTIILASAAVIAALGPVVTKIISALSRKQVVVTNRVLVPVETTDGKVVCDKEGNPVFQWVDEVSIVESRVPSSETTSASIDTPLGFKFTFKAETRG